jgi:rubrerythrin
VDFLALLDRCVALEHGAGEIYRGLAERFADDTELCALWKAMAEDESGHARKLATWRALVAAERPDHRTGASGFEDGVAALEKLVAGARVTARHCSSPDEAFAIALALETSELDAIYTRLLQSSPIARFPDLAETARRETAGHHAPLIRIVRGRSRDEQNLLRASLLAMET